MKKLIPVFLLAAIPLLAQSTLYVPTNTGVVKQVQLSPGINIILDMSGTLQTPIPQTIISGVLLATPNVAIGQQALADCQAGKVPPQQQPLVGTPACSVNQQNAVNADILVRVKAALATISSATLQNNGLQIIQ